MESLKNLSNNSKVLLGLGVIALGYYLWKRSEEIKEQKQLKNGANA